MNKSAKTLLGVMLGINFFYCVLIYKMGEHEGEYKAFTLLKEKLEEVLQ